MEAVDMIELDGSYGEGGGQIVRTALAISALTGLPFEVKGIRRGRKESGLKAQHLHCVKALQQLCNAQTSGVEIGSKELTFVPGKFRARNLMIDIGTAGSTTLLLQSLLLPCMFADKAHTLTLCGGTDVAWSMPYDYFANVLVPQLKPLCGIKPALVRRGYYPKGGGELKIQFKPMLQRNDSFEAVWARLQGLHHFDLVEQAELLSIKGVSHASEKLAGARVAERQAMAAEQELKKLGCPVDIRVEYCPTLSPGSGLTLWAIFSKTPDEIDETRPIRLGADALGAPGKPAERVGFEAAEGLIREISAKAPVDRHLADNLVPFLALCKPSRIKVTELTTHAITNIYVVEKFLGKQFSLDEEKRIISTVLQA